MNVTLNRGVPSFLSLPLTKTTCVYMFITQMWAVIIGTQIFCFRDMYVGYIPPHYKPKV